MLYSEARAPWTSHVKPQVQNEKIVRVVARAPRAQPAADESISPRGPGRLGAVKRPEHFPIKIHFVWGFCMGAQGA